VSAGLVLSGARKMENRVQQHLDAVTQLHMKGAIAPVSVILFGSAASGAQSQTSDVDLILVVPENTPPEEKRLLRAAVTELEVLHGLRLPEGPRKKALESFAEHAGGHAHASFVCTRDDLISGDAARIFGLRGTEAVFLERMFLGSVIVSARTVDGEDLLGLVPLPSLRRLDVFKSLFRSTGFILFCAAAYPLLREATRYAMSTLKHSLHSCYFCYHIGTAPLNDEVAFFSARLGGDWTLRDLLRLRKEYRRSFAFVLGCVAVLFRLHWKTLRENGFPRAVVRALSQ